MCVIPFEWKTKHWYEVRLQELATSQWEGTVTDMETEQTVSAGIISVRADNVWVQPVLGVSYQQAILNRDCQLGLAPITMHYTESMKNRGVRLTRTVTVRILSNIVQVSTSLRAHYLHD